VDANLQAQLSIAALACSVVALFFSVLAAFPGLKLVLAAVRDGVLWLALLVLLGGIAFITWRQADRRPPAAPQAAAAGHQSAQ
jgi:hypothetical protein